MKKERRKKKEVFTYKTTYAVVYKIDELMFIGG